MQKRKGFTLVELVIVIAVIAILAGVLIGTFASVLNKAQETAKLQQIKADEHDQKADDLLKKIENSNWYGWEDFETSIVEKITKVIDSATKEGTPDQAVLSQSVSKGVTEAMAKYYAEHAMGNTSLTEDQVKAIVENALGSFKFETVTKAQVEAVVNAAVSKMTTGLTAVQVQKIVNAAADRVEAGQLTAGQITTIVSTVVAEQKANLADKDTVDAAVKSVVKAIADKPVSTITAKEVEEIINSAVQSAGSTAWVTPEAYATETTFKVAGAEEVKGLATLVNGGYDFAGKTITLEASAGETTLKLDKKDWTPIGNSYETQFKGTISGGSTPLVVDGLTLTEQFNAVKNGFLIDCSSTNNMDKVGIGFVAYLGEGATLENITFKNVNINIKDDRMDGIHVGVAVGYLEGGTIKNVKVESGSITTVYRAGGLVGCGYKGSIINCQVGTDTDPFEITTTGANDNHSAAGGVLGYWRNFASNEVSVDDNLVISNVTTYTTISVPTGASAGKVFGQIEYDNDRKNTTSAQPWRETGGAGFYINGVPVVLGQNQHGPAFDEYLATGTNKTDLGLSDSTFQ